MDSLTFSHTRWPFCCRGVSPERVMQRNHSARQLACTTPSVARFFVLIIHLGRAHGAAEWPRRLALCRPWQAHHGLSLPQRADDENKLGFDIKSLGGVTGKIHVAGIKSTATISHCFPLSPPSSLSLSPSAACGFVSLSLVHCAALVTLYISSFVFSLPRSRCLFRSP